MLAVCAVLDQKLKKFPGRDITTFSSLSITNLFLKNTNWLIVLPTNEGSGFVGGSLEPTAQFTHETWLTVNTPLASLTSCIVIVLALNSIFLPGSLHSSHTPSPSLSFSPKNFT